MALEHKLANVDIAKALLKSLFKEMCMCLFQTRPLSTYAHTDIIMDSNMLANAPWVKAVNVAQHK